ncbi:hypothetical protein TWF481_002874 [Arthrobotrys musiformis]|uniref:Uncharacterized protein n=1 Tax=Arthrobotrys musiformis TaxID=47236 RepID=A0AAV9VT76_9PEZI
MLWRPAANVVVGSSEDAEIVGDGMIDCCKPISQHYFSNHGDVTNLVILADNRCMGASSSAMSLRPPWQKSFQRVLCIYNSRVNSCASMSLLTSWLAWMSSKALTSVWTKGGGTAGLKSTSKNPFPLPVKIAW